MTKLRLHTALKTFEQLHKLADQKSRSKSVLVRQADLKALLMDHSALVRDCKREIEEP
jgi:hypothetical protein